MASLLVFEGEKLKIFANWSKKFVETFEGLYLDVIMQFNKK